MEIETKIPNNSVINTTLKLLELQSSTPGQKRRLTRHSPLSPTPTPLLLSHYLSFSSSPPLSLRAWVFDILGGRERHAPLACVPC